MSYVKRMKSLVEITKIVTESDNFFEIKDIIVSNMLEAVQPTKACVNLFYDAKFNYAHLVCSSTLFYIPKIFPKNEEFGTKIDFDLYPEYIHEAVRKKENIIVEDVRKDPRAVVELSLAENEGYVGRAVFPFVINDKCVGFMTCYLMQDDVLDSDSIDFISQVASLMALSISITNKNKGIQDLITKLRNSITNINKASRRLYSSKDMFYYLKKMSAVLSETTDSLYSMINIYKISENGDIVGQKLSICQKYSRLDDLNSMMKPIIASHKMSEFMNNLNIEFINGEKINNCIYYKQFIDSDTMMIILCVGNKVYNYDDKSTISIMAKQMANSLQNFENESNVEKHKGIENGLTMLKRQQQLIMENVTIKRFNDKEIFYHVSPSNDVGGDFYHSKDVGEKIVFIVADVMGHGIVANYMVALIKGAFDILTHKTFSAQELLTKLNCRLFEEFDHMGAFATVLVGFIDKKNMKLEMANAGHYYPIILDKDKNIVEFDFDNREIPVGIMEDTVYTEYELNLADMSMMCIFTDGIIELKNEKDEEYGSERLKNFLKENVNLDKDQIINNIKKEIDMFSQDVESRDDILVTFIK
ncbi:GAF domain-containing SpoIIE family protein phosphatase [Peptostreptococcus equinus]|uniref:SpoIIE family protein phosphatase n=1 Tax=Peptostreptococcus equinus TaxID=3003601 RepID=A0ABY7JSY4_9FIRM|nr:GAF domain-containing SpoIIE family protein phosphatase [Peptostreptococcus sp. CBA3647]WAW15586.1 SpoIIE family protein phosphatase [Peptostreptococcus sp. CBA3647]